MKSKSYTKKAWMFFLMISPVFTQAEGQILQGKTYLSNPLFNTLLAVIILLLIFIVVLTQVLKNIAQSDFLIKKKTDGQENTFTKSAGIILLTSLAISANAQTVTHSKDWTVGGLDMFTFYFMIGVIILEGIFLTTLLFTLHQLLKSETSKEVVKKLKDKSILEKLNASVEIEKEEEIILSHNYDGIRELDNDLPPWWKYGFYLTIIVAVVYLIHFHIAGTGDLQTAEYNKEIEKAKIEIAEFMKGAANNVDETSVQMLKDGDIESGKQLFISACAACHGKLGEGGVGPNLTDEYWVHGGSLADIFKSIKYGWADKGMKSWKEDLSPIQIAQVTSFIKTLYGTNPPNGKAPQGDVFKDAAQGENSDSLNVKAAADTLKQVVEKTTH